MCKKHSKPCLANSVIGCTWAVLKWETPEQKKGRTGIEPPESAACYVRFNNVQEDRYHLMTYGSAKSYYPTVGKENMIILFDNGNYGEPPADWAREA
jgi:hypothetical protein